MLVAVPAWSVEELSEALRTVVPLLTAAPPPRAETASVVVVAGATDDTGGL